MLGPSGAFDPGSWGRLWDGVPTDSIGGNPALRRLVISGAQQGFAGGGACSGGQAEEEPGPEPDPSGSCRPSLLTRGGGKAGVWPWAPLQCSLQGSHSQVKLVLVGRKEVLTVPMPFREISVFNAVCPLLSPPSPTNSVCLLSPSVSPICVLAFLSPFVQPLLLSIHPALPSCLPFFFSFWDSINKTAAIRIGEHPLQTLLSPRLSAGPVLPSLPSLPLRAG